MNKLISLSLTLWILIVLTIPINSATTVKALVEKQARAWETQDVPSLIEDFAPDAVFQAGGFTFKGVKAIQKAAEDYFRTATDTKVKIKRLIIDHNQGAVEWDWSDRNQTTGKPSAAEDAIVFELRRDGKIIYWREYIEKKKVIEAQ
jgi:uncharacterized protein (TIGR02246 family)